MPLELNNAHNLGINVEYKGKYLEYTHTRSQIT